jgi:argininosuccinate synthase
MTAGAEQVDGRRAGHEADYLLGTSIARPLIAAEQVEVARQTGDDAVGRRSGYGSAA